MGKPIAITRALVHGVDEVARIPTKPVNYVTRTESGFATWIIRFSAGMAIATSPC